MSQSLYCTKRIKPYDSKLIVNVVPVHAPVLLAALICPTADLITKVLAYKAILFVAQSVYYLFIYLLLKFLSFAVITAPVGV